jgi:hypothetical protein
VDETQNWIPPTSGQTDANALSTKKVNALSTKDKIFPEEENDKNNKKDRDREETINTIQTIKETAEEL